MGEPINEEEVKNEISSQFFYHNQPYFVNDLSLESSKVKEKERDTIDETYQMVIEVREKLRKIKEIKSFFNELYSLSSCSYSQEQQPIITNLIQSPIIQPIIPPVTTTAPLQQMPPPQPAQSSQEQEQKNEKIINPETDLFTNLFITSTLIVPDIVRRLRGVGKGGEDSIIIIPREPSLSPYMMTSTFNNNNNSKKREEENLLNVNTNKEEPREDSHDIEEYSLSRHNLLIDNEDDNVINNNIDYDDSINIDNNYDNSSDVSLVIKRDDHGDIYE
jgi:hypothetical protein